MLENNKNSQVKTTKISKKEHLKNLLCNDTIELGLVNKNLYLTIRELKDKEHTKRFIVIENGNNELVNVVYETKTINDCINYISSILYLKHKNLI